MEVRIQRQSSFGAKVLKPIHIYFFGGKGSNYFTLFLHQSKLILKFHFSMNLVYIPVLRCRSPCVPGARSCVTGAVSATPQKPSRFSSFLFQGQQLLLWTHSALLLWESFLELRMLRLPSNARVSLSLLRFFLKHVKSLSG